MRNAWRLAARSLKRNRRRNLATAVAITLGTAAVVLLGSYALRIERFLRASTVYLQRTGHLVVLKQGALEAGDAQPARHAFSAAEQRVAREVLGALPGVELVTGQLKGTGLAGNGCKTVPFLALGVEPEAEGKVLRHREVLADSPELALPVAGKDLSAYPGLEGAVAVSAGLYHLLGKRLVHDQLPAGAEVKAPDCASPQLKAQLAADANLQLAGLTWAGSLSAVDAEVVNVFHTPLAETEDGTVLASLATLQALYDTDAVSSLRVFLDDAARMPELRATAEAALRARGLAVEVHGFDDARVSPYYAGTMPLIYSTVGFVGALVAAVVLLSVLNAMTLAVLERTQELGTFRSLGFTRGQLTALLVREMVLLASASVAAGLALGVAVCTAINHAGIRFNPPGVTGSILFLLTPSVGLCLALFATLVPLAALATWLAVRRRVAAPLTTLLAAPAT